MHRYNFKALVHENRDLSKIQKLYYLRASLKGIAVEVIHSLESSADNYEVAWSLLRERFEHKKLITSQHMQALFDISHIRSESGTLLSFLDET